MARITSVTFERVSEICLDLFCGGKTVSFDRVYEQLGRKGSAEIVRDLITRWQEETGAALRRRTSIPGIPDALVNRHDEYLRSVWAEACDTASLALNTEREALAEERIAMQTAVAEAQQEVQAAQEKVRLAEVRVEEITRAKESAESKANALASDLEQLVDANTRLRESLAALVEKNNGLAEQHRQALASERTRYDELLLNERLRHEAAQSDAETRHQNSLSREREIWAGERQFLHTNTDQMRQSLSAQMAAAERRAQTAEALAEEWRNRTTSCKQEASLWQGRAEARAQENARIQERLELALNRIEALEEMQPKEILEGDAPSENTKAAE